MAHGIPDPIDFTWILVLGALLLVLGTVVLGYYAFGECTRVHPVWYCLVR